jgi:hypothetical protein
MWDMGIYIIRDMQNVSRKIYLVLKECCEWDRMMVE